MSTLLEQGVICPQDLQQSQCCSKELVQELFLLACLEGGRCHCESETGEPH
jgi:hypothetical protein